MHPPMQAQGWMRLGMTKRVIPHITHRLDMHGSSCVIKLQGEQMNKLALGTMVAVMFVFGAIFLGTTPSAFAGTLQSCGNEYAIQTYYEFTCHSPDYNGPIDFDDVLVGKDCQTMDPDGTIRACSFRWYEHYDIDVVNGCSSISNVFWVENWGITSNC
ncbi:MAG TPA: hypothetical protein VH165_35655 [Kofleriaceae bacterium]|jgi:hypothetical protein|nr:hypothetical protein [Kofleriaceae bacterium]